MASNRLARWEHATATPMMLLSLAWLVIATIFVIRDPVDPSRSPLRIALFAIWACFLIDYLVRLAIASNRLAFFRKNLIDLGSVIVPILRPFHLLTDLRKIPYFAKQTGSSLRVLWTSYAVLFTVLFIYTISLAVFDVERDAPGANILSLGDALWWAAVTLATVGYGDMYPVTIAGRILAVILMMGGVVIVGIATAMILSALNERLARIRARHEQSDPQDRQVESDTVSDS